MKRLICLLVLLVPCLARAAYVQGYLIDITGTASSPLITFDPQSTPITGGPGVVLDIVRQVRPVNGYFSNYLAGGLYTVRFGAGGNTIGIAVPADNNVYWFTNLADLATFTYPNIYGAISSRVLTGTGFTVTTNNAGEWNESISLVGTNLGSGSVSNALALAVNLPAIGQGNGGVATTNVTDFRTLIGTPGITNNNHFTGDSNYIGGTVGLAVKENIEAGDWGGAQGYAFRAGQNFFNLYDFVAGSGSNSLIDWQSDDHFRLDGVVPLTFGSISNMYFQGDGESLTNLSASNLETGTVPNARLDADLQALATNNASGLSNLNASSIASGTLSDYRLATSAKPFLNVKSFPESLALATGLTGAAGNGSSDDTAAFNHALNYCSTNATYSTLFIPEGHYRFAAASGGLIVPDGVTLLGESFKSTTLTANAGLWTNSFIRSALGADGNTSTFAKFSVQNLNLHQVGVATNCIYIDLTGTRNASVERVYISSGFGNGQIGILFSDTNAWVGVSETCFFDSVVDCVINADTAIKFRTQVVQNNTIHWLRGITGAARVALDFTDAIGTTSMNIHNVYFVASGAATEPVLPAGYRGEGLFKSNTGFEGYTSITPPWNSTAIDVQNVNYHYSTFDGISVSPGHVFEIENQSPILPDSFDDQYFISGFAIQTNTATSYINIPGIAMNQHYVHATASFGHTVTNFGSNYTAYVVINTNRTAYVDSRMELKPSWETNASHLFAARLDIDTDGNITNLTDLRVFLPAPTFRSVTLTNSDGGTATTITSSGVDTPSINTTALDADLQELAARATTQPYTFSERVTFNGGMAPAASEGTAIDFQGTGDKVKQWSTNADFALTFSGTPVYGDSREFHFTNASASAVTIDFPQAVFDLASTNSPQSTRTNFTVPGSRVVYFRFHPSGDRIDLLTSEATGAASSGFQNPAIADLDMDGNDILDVGNRTGSGSWTNYGAISMGVQTNTLGLAVYGIDVTGTNIIALVTTNTVVGSSSEVIIGARAISGLGANQASLKLIAGRDVRIQSGSGNAISLISDSITLGSANGVTVTTDLDGAITFTGASTGADEALTWNYDDFTDRVHVSSTTGVTNVNFGTIGLEGGTFTPTNGIFMPTNTYVPSPLTTGGWLWNSNQVLYWITSAQTNVVSDGR